MGNRRRIPQYKQCNSSKLWMESNPLGENGKLTEKILQQLLE
jgi:hypothetical protein